MSFSLTLRKAEAPFASGLYKVVGVLACVLFVASSSLAAPSSSRVAQRLKATADVRWVNAPLRKTLVRLGTVFDVPMFIDRRVDSDWTVMLSLEKTPLEEVLRQATGQHGLSFAIVGPVLYVGPASVADKLPQLMESNQQQLASAKPAARRRFQKAKPIDWARLTEPRQLIADGSENRSLKLVNPEAVPHDLWPASSLPAMPWGDQLTLLLIGFDRTWELEQGVSWRVKSIGK